MVNYSFCTKNSIRRILVFKDESIQTIRFCSFFLSISIKKSRADFSFAQLFFCVVELSRKR